MLHVPMDSHKLRNWFSQAEGCLHFLQFSSYHIEGENAAVRSPVARYTLTHPSKNFRHIALAMNKSHFIFDALDHPGCFRMRSENHGWLLCTRARLVSARTDAVRTLPHSSSSSSRLSCLTQFLGT